jgi:tetratricopeptide (TPR) repeat protein
METSNWQAFNLATEALRDIDRFVSSSSKNRTILVEARQKLAGAVHKDPTFIRAQYYSAIVDDMLGQPAKASTELERLLDQKPTFRDEAEYNLGVSYYHQYSKDEMTKAISAFENVVQHTADIPLKYMASAGLVRAFAMMVLHSSKEGNQQDAVKFTEKSRANSESLLENVKSDESLDQKTKKEIKWRTLNGRGVGRMFYSDYENDLGTRKKDLQQALKDFEAADKLSPNNWEIVCNFGSVHMRLGYLEKLFGHKDASLQEFTTAHQRLQDVVGRIWPNYGFALYETGRICRLEQNFQEALVWFEKAMAIPEDERNVKTKTVEGEIAKARSGSDKFP